MQFHLIPHRTNHSHYSNKRAHSINIMTDKEIYPHKLIAPRCIGIKGAFATNSPSGAKSAHEKSSLSLMLVLIDVCWRDRPIASATLMKRFAKSVSMIGSGPFEKLSFFEFAMSKDDRGVYGKYGRKIARRRLFYVQDRN